MMLRSIIVATALVLAAGQAQAAPITYDFEGTAATGFSGGLTVLALTEGGVTMTLTRESGAAFDVDDISGFGGPASYGTRTLNPFFDTSDNWFIADFSSLISSFSIDAGDFTPSDIDFLQIQAFDGPNATGALVSSFVSAPCCAVGGGFVGISGGVAGADIASIRFIGGSLISPNSLFYDNVTVEVVPEPASLLLLGAGLAGGVRRWRKRRSDV